MYRTVVKARATDGAVTSYNDNQCRKRELKPEIQTLTLDHAARRASSSVGTSPSLQITIASPYSPSAGLPDLLKGHRADSTLSDGTLRLGDSRSFRRALDAGFGKDAVVCQLERHHDVVGDLGRDLPLLAERNIAGTSVKCRVNRGQGDQPIVRLRAAYQPWARSPGIGGIDSACLNCSFVMENHRRVPLLSSFHQVRMLRSSCLSGQPLRHSRHVQRSTVTSTMEIRSVYTTQPKQDRHVRPAPIRKSPIAHWLAVALLVVCQFTVIPMVVMMASDTLSTRNHAVILGEGATTANTTTVFKDVPTPMP